MMTALKNLLTRRPAAVSPPVCRWAGPHSGEPVCLLVIERECGHIEPGTPACSAHLQVLLRTGGVAERPAPCFDPDCGIISYARVGSTADLPRY